MRSQEGKNSAQLMQLAYVLGTGIWSVVLLVVWQHGVRHGTVTLTTQVNTLEGILLSVAILAAVWRRKTVANLNAMLLIGMTIWVVTRVVMRILVEGSLQGVSFILVSALTAVAFTVLKPAAAMTYGVVGWLMLAVATLLSKLDVSNELIASAFAIFMVSYSSLSGRQVMTERRQRLAAEHRASTDKLTGLLNRSGGEAALAEAAETHRQRGTPATVVLLDIDHFKSVNDRFGHAAGDETLRHVSRALVRSVREGDVVCRWGGEEFLILFLSTPLQQAGGLLQRVLEGVRSHEVPGVGRVTVSAGACELSEAADRDAVLNLADRRLYAAKTGGRNRAVLADSASLPAAAEA